MIMRVALHGESTVRPVHRSFLSLVPPPSSCLLLSRNNSGGTVEKIDGRDERAVRYARDKQPYDP